MDETDPHGVMAELSGVQRRKKRVAAFRKAAMRRQRMMGGAGTSLRVIAEERNRKRSSTGGAAVDGSGGGSGLPTVDRLRLVTTESRQSPHSSSPLPSSSLLTPSSARSDSGGYGSTDDGGRTSAVSATTKLWLRATEKVVSERHMAEREAEGQTGEVKEDGKKG